MTARWWQFSWYVDEEIISYYKQQTTFLQANVKPMKAFSRYFLFAFQYLKMFLVNRMSKVEGSRKILKKSKFADIYFTGLWTK